MALACRPVKTLELDRVAGRGMRIGHFAEAYFRCRPGEAERQRDRDLDPAFVGSGSKRELSSSGLMSASADCGHNAENLRCLTEPARVLRLPSSFQSSTPFDSCSNLELGDWNTYKIFPPVMTDR